MCPHKFYDEGWNARVRGDQFCNFASKDWKDGWRDCDSAPEPVSHAGVATNVPMSITGAQPIPMGGQHYIKPTAAENDRAGMMHTLTIPNQPAPAKGIEEPVLVLNLFARPNEGWRLNSPTEIGLILSAPSLHDVLVKVPMAIAALTAKKGE